MSRFADAKTYSEDEIRSWGAPQRAAQGRSLGDLTDDILERQLAICACAAIAKGGSDAQVWSTAMAGLSDAMDQYNGDNKTIYLGFRDGDWNGGRYGTNGSPMNKASAAVVVGRHWTAAVAWT